HRATDNQMDIRASIALADPVNAGPTLLVVGVTVVKRVKDRRVRRRQRDAKPGRLDLRHEHPAVVIALELIHSLSTLRLWNVASDPSVVDGTLVQFSQNGADLRQETSKNHHFFIGGEQVVKRLG